MATRYSGDLTITLTYRDPPKGMSPNGDYRATISWPARSRLTGGRHRHTVYVGAPARLQHGVDSPAAFDSAAHAAISFASEEEPEIGEAAAMTDRGWYIARTRTAAWGRGWQDHPNLEKLNRALSTSFKKVRGR